MREMVAPPWMRESQRELGIEARTLVARDGVSIFYEVVGRGDKVMLLANGLGGRLYSWEPIIRAFSSEYRIITWDYRGLFESGAPDRIRRLAIPEHAEDIHEIMDAEGVKTATMVGWSMGVQVSLETASLFPERIERLILLNGTYGKALQTGFQPLFRVPWMNNVLHEFLDFVHARPGIIDWARTKVHHAQPLLRKLGKFYGTVLYDNPRLEDAMVQYTNDLFATDFGNYLRLFQELDAHSVYHLLRNIHQPSLIVSGRLDLLTPAYQSKEMSRKLPRSKHISLPFGSHFVLLEYPDKLVSLIRGFLDGSIRV